MRPVFKFIVRAVGVIFVLAVTSLAALSCQASATLFGRVLDERGDLITEATVTVTDATGVERTAQTKEGLYMISGLAPGKCSVRVSATGFADYEKKNVTVAAGRREMLEIRLVIVIKEDIVVKADKGLSTDTDSNSSQLIIRDKELNALPDDPDDFRASLQGLVGSAPGPNGIQTLVDGFSSGTLPPKDTIRELRINRNPFSAEHERPGFGVVEIFTKPGSPKFHGQAFFNVTDSAMNSRNPFAPNRAQYQSRLSGGSLSGPLIAKKLSFFLDFERRDIVDNILINATVLDSALTATPFKQVVLTPQVRTNFSPRFDYQFDEKQALIFRYGHTRLNLNNAGLTTFTLPTGAYDLSSTEHLVQATYTVTLSPTVFNDTRLQYISNDLRQQSPTLGPTINVLESFIGGGSQIGNTARSERRWEISNNTAWTKGTHTFRAGGRIRAVSIKDLSSLNFGGTFIFSGGIAPELDENNRRVVGANGQPSLVAISSLERYRRTLLFQAQSLPPAQARELGGGATQFTIATGDPLVTVRQIDFGGFIQDDWRVRPDLTLMLGLRYEVQNNITSRFNIGPRIAFVWAPATGGRPAKTIFRGGYGIFYDRFGENLTLQALRYNGITQNRFIISDETAQGRQYLDSFPNAPRAPLESFTDRATITRIAGDLQAPYTLLSGAAVERQLPLRVTLSTFYVNTRRVHDLRSRNINAPGTDHIRPFGDVGNIFEYESNAFSNQHHLMVQGRYLNKRLMLFANYVWSSSKNDSDGSSSFPENSYDLRKEYGRAAQDVRHYFVLVANYTAPWKITLSPFITVRSGFPFNITTGSDSNDDGLFTDRPAFATDLNKPGVRITPFGAFDPNPGPDQQIIPRNFGSGPGFFQLNLRISKTFGFSGLHWPTNAAKNGDNGAQQKEGIFGRSTTSDEKRYKLTVALQIQNLTNHTNFGPIIGSLNSPFFGQATSIFGGFGFGTSSNPSYNRRVEAQVRFTF